MHEYKCLNPESGCGKNGVFLTNFAPVFDECPAHCPSCGNALYVEYIGEKQTGNPTTELDQMQRIVENLSKCVRVFGGFDLSELDQWLDKDFSRMADLINDIRMELER